LGFNSYRQVFQFIIIFILTYTVNLDPESSTSNEGFKLKARYTHQAHDKDINTVAISPNDKLFATGSQDKTAKVWSCKDGSLVGVCKGHKRGIWCVRFSPVDQVLATSSGDKTIRLWSLKDFSCIKVSAERYRDNFLLISWSRLLKDIQVQY
jgi:WD40 repeat protein